MHIILVNILVILFIQENHGHFLQIRRSVQDGVGGLIDKYIGPLRKLKADFPDHAFEVEMELHGMITHAPPKRQKIIRIHQKPVFVNANIPTEKTIMRMPNVLCKSTNIAPPSKEPICEMEKSSTVEKNISTKKPLYMEDLKKALKEFEKKILKQKTTTTRMDNLMKYIEALKSQNPLDDFNGPHGGGLNQVNNIMRLFNKGVQIQTHVPKASENNMNWMQLRIPRQL